MSSYTSDKIFEITDYPLEQLEMGMTFKFNESYYTYNGSDHLNSISGEDNGSFFKKLGVDASEKNALVKKWVGYSDGGGFPCFRENADGVKMINGIYEMIAEKLGITLKGKELKVEVKETPDFTDFKIGQRVIRIFGHPIYLIKKIVKTDDSKKPKGTQPKAKGVSFA